MSLFFLEKSTYLFYLEKMLLFCCCFPYFKLWRFSFIWLLHFLFESFIFVVRVLISQLRCIYDYHFLVSIFRFIFILSPSMSILFSLILNIVLYLQQHKSIFPTKKLFRVHLHSLVCLRFFLMDWFEPSVDQDLSNGETDNERMTHACDYKQPPPFLWDRHGS